MNPKRLIPLAVAICCALSAGPADAAVIARPAIISRPATFRTAPARPAPRASFQLHPSVQPSPFFWPTLWLLTSPNHAALAEDCENPKPPVRSDEKCAEDRR